MTVWGISGRPYLDLSRHLPLGDLDALDEEIAYGLARIQPLEYTGGSHRSMGIVPDSMWHDPWVDYGQVIARFDRQEFARFVSLGDDPAAFDLERYRTYEFGEEREHPLTFAQMQYLKFRYKAYFPWQVFYEMVPNAGWDDKANGRGKDFTDEAKRLFPGLVSLAKRLPFRSIGRCNILGLDAYHHGTVHQDADPEDPIPDPFITICPRGDKRLFLWDEEKRQKTYVAAKAYWFNDHGYHGVEADPHFRYSVRVDGEFTPEFMERLRRDFALDV